VRCQDATIVLCSLAVGPSLKFRSFFAALVTEPPLVKLHFLEMLFQVSPAKEFLRGVMTVSAPFTGCALHHPLPRARVSQMPFRIVLALHVLFGEAIRLLRHRCTALAPD
jgi:hypothetical protein